MGVTQTPSANLRPRPAILAEPSVGPEERRRVGEMITRLAGALTYSRAKRRPDYIAKPKTPEEIAAEWAENPCGISPEALAALKLNSL